jgi:hypothetical protein
MFVAKISSQDRYLGEGVILNISTSGCRIEGQITSQIPPDTQVVVRFYPSELATRIEVEKAQVRWSESNAFGVEFLQFQPDDHAALKQLIKQLA